MGRLAESGHEIMRGQDVEKLLQENTREKKKTSLVLKSLLPRQLLLYLVPYQLQL